MRDCHRARALPPRPQPAYSSSVDGPQRPVQQQGPLHRSGQYTRSYGHGSEGRRYRPAAVGGQRHCAAVRLVPQWTDAPALNVSTETVLSVCAGAMTAGRRKSDRSGEEQPKPMQTRPPPMAAAARKRTMERYATVVVELAQAAVLPVLRTAEVVSSMADTQSCDHQESRGHILDSSSIRECQTVTSRLQTNNHQESRGQTTLHRNGNLQVSCIIRLQSILSGTKRRP